MMKILLRVSCLGKRVRFSVYNQKELSLLLNAVKMFKEKDLMIILYYGGDY